MDFKMATLYRGGNDFIVALLVDGGNWEACQKRALDPLIDSYELPCGCWDLNSGLLER